MKCAGVMKLSVTRCASTSRSHSARVPRRQDDRGRADEERRHRRSRPDRRGTRGPRAGTRRRAASPTARPDPAAPASPARRRTRRARRPSAGPSCPTCRRPVGRAFRRAPSATSFVKPIVDEGIDEVEIVDEHLGRRVLDDVRDFVRLQVRVDEHDRALQLRDRGPHLEERNGVREHDRDPVGGADAPAARPRAMRSRAGVEVDVWW